MKYIFGPVFSRRLGISLGVDLVPYKVCSMDCLYCEVGKTTEKTLERAEYVPIEAVKEELKVFLDSRPKLDFITFSGYGEPTLHSKLGELVKFLKENYSEYRIALLTNSSLLNRSDVIAEIERIDVILPSLDAAKEETFRKINRPVENLNLSKIVSGIKKVLDETPAKVWLETVFVKGINDSEEELEEFKELLKDICPHKWQIGTVTRPPAYGVRDLTYADLKRIAKTVNYPKTEIISYRKRESELKESLEDLKGEVLSIVKRRPCPTKEIAAALGLDEEDVEKIVEELKAEGKIKEILFGGVSYVKGI